MIGKFIVSITGYNGSTCNACPDLKKIAYQMNGNIHTGYLNVT